MISKYLEEKELKEMLEKEGIVEKNVPCPECGAKSITGGGKTWIPRHKKGCSKSKEK